MRTPNRSLLALTGLCLPVLALLAPRPAATVHAPAALAAAIDVDDDQYDDHHGEEEVLHEAMETLNDGLRDLRGLMREEDLEAMLAVVNTIQAAVVAGKGEVPETVEAVDADQRTAFVRDFRAEQLTLLEKLCQLERLLLAEDLEAAREFLPSEIMSMKRGAHSRFKNPGGWTPQ